MCFCTYNIFWNKVVGETTQECVGNTTSSEKEKDNSGNGQSSMNNVSYNGNKMLFLKYFIIIYFDI